MGVAGLMAHSHILDFVPERSTDFIFSVFSEEFGFIGASMLILVIFDYYCARIGHCRQCSK